MTSAAGAAAAHVSPSRWSALAIARLLDLPAPTDEQRRVIEAPPDPLLVVAGAGSGKTETMAARVVWLVANGLVAPEQVLGLTFTRKAAGELAQRLRFRLRALRAHRIGDGVGGLGGSDDGEPTVSTYHAYAGRIVGEHALRLGIEPHARLLSEASTWTLAADVVRAWTGPMDAVRESFGTVVDAVLALAGECAEHLVAPTEVADYLGDLLERASALPRKADDAAAGDPYTGVKKVLRTLAARRQLMPIVTRYIDVKRHRDCLDFGDQLALAAQLAQGFAQVGAGERARYSVVLLDEYQDTSHAQLVLLTHLFGAGHPVTAVGDPCQSIYGWRGASAGALARFPGEFARADGAPASVAFLSTSWRNDEQILAAANIVSAPLREAGRVGRAVVPELRARAGAGVGRVVAALHETVEDEAEAIADALAGVWHADDAVAARGGQRRTVAVLCRKRSQFDLIEASLRARGLPVEVVGLGGLLSTPEVADVVATLHVLHDPTRGDALMRLLTGPRWRLGPRDLEGLGRWSRRLARARATARPERAPGVPQGESGPAGPPVGGAVEPPVDPQVEPDTVEERSLVEALDDLPRRPWRDADGVGLSEPARARLAMLAAELRGLRARVGLPLPELVADVVRTSGLDIEVAARAGRSPALARAHLDRFLDVAADFADSAPSATLGGFLSWLAAAQSRERGLEPGQVEVSRDAVQVLTVHAAKGLEWDAVAVPGLVEGVFPACGDEDGGWLSGLGALPYPLRGDAASLPDWRWRRCASQQELDAARLEFRRAAGAHEMAEERRLAYVALTRARSLLWLSGHRWGDAATPREVSRFLAQLVRPDDVDGDDDGGMGGVTGDGVAWVTWTPPPTGPNPRSAAPSSHPWPIDPLGGRRDAVQAGAALVRAALDGVGDIDGDADSSADPWSEEIDLLLAERASARGDGEGIDVLLPPHLSTSRLVRLAEDPDALARDIRRPVPVPPRPAARRGTAFHAWLEQRFGQAAMVDLLDLPGAADESAGDDEDLEVLKASYLASEWADRMPVEVEVSFETSIGAMLLRGRADAVFATPDGGFEVVDWKTGRPPVGEHARVRAVQLAAYRLAWSRLQGVPLERVSAAFFYAATGQTVRPVDLLDEAGLLALVDTLPEASRSVSTP